MRHVLTAFVAAIGIMMPALALGEVDAGRLANAICNQKQEQYRCDAAQGYGTKYETINGKKVLCWRGHDCQGDDTTGTIRVSGKCYWKAGGNGGGGKCRVENYLGRDGKPHPIEGLTDINGAYMRYQSGMNAEDSFPQSPVSPLSFGGGFLPPLPELLPHQSPTSLFDTGQPSPTDALISSYFYAPSAEKITQQLRELAYPNAQPQYAAPSSYANQASTFSSSFEALRMQSSMFSLTPNAGVEAGGKSGFTGGDIFGANNTFTTGQSQGSPSQNGTWLDQTSQNVISKYNSLVNYLRSCKNSFCIGG